MIETSRITDESMQSRLFFDEHGWSRVIKPDAQFSAEHSEGSETMITITKDEAESYVDMVENHLYDIIRGDTEIDSVEWLFNLLSIYRKCKTALAEGERA